MNRVEYIPLWHGGISFGYFPKSGIAGYSGSSIFSFLKNLQIYLQSGFSSLQSLPHYLIGLFGFLVISFLSSSYILDINPLSDVELVMLFSKYVFPLKGI